MAATLMGGAFYDLKVEQDKRGPIFGWLTKCFESHDDEVHCVVVVERTRPLSLFTGSCYW